MKLNCRNLFFASSATITLTLSTPVAHAQRYWDNNGNTTGFGNSTRPTGGTWGNLGSGNTTGNSTQGWSANTTGVGTGQLANTYTTTTSDALNFGNGTLGLATGTIAVSGTVGAGSITFASGSGNITLSGGTINLGAAATITTANATSANTISGGITGAATSLTKAGAGTLNLSGLSSTSGSNYAGTTIIGAGTLQITGTGNLTGGLTFGASAGATTVGSLDLSNGNATFGSLLVQTNSSANNTITIGAGKILATNGNVTIGHNSGTSQVNNLTVTGASGSWTVTNSAATATFIVGGATTTASNLSTVDLSGLGTFNVNMSNAASVFKVGDSNTATTGTAVVKLAVNNTITAGTVSIGGNSGSGNAKTLSLGTGNNTINANNIIIGDTGGQRSNGLIDFQHPSNGNLTIRSLTGATSTANLTMVNSNNSGGSAQTAQLLMAGHTVDVSFNAIVMATRTDGTTSGGIADITFDSGNFTANTIAMTGRGGSTAVSGLTTGNITIGGGTASLGAVTMAVNTNTNAATGLATANLNISGGNVTANSINMATAGATNSVKTATGNINLTGTGLLTLSGNITRTGGAGTENATITLNGGTLNMGSRNIGNATAGISLLAQSGTLQNVAAINGTGGLTKTTTGTLVLSGNNTYTGNTTVSDGILSLGSSLAMQNSALDTLNSVVGNSTAGLRSSVASLTLGGLTGNKNLADVFTTTSGNYTGLTALTLNPGTGVTNSYSADIGTGSGTLSVTKTGLGTQTLSGNNTYTGTTSVSAGILSLTGNLTGGGAIAVNGTGVLTQSSTSVINATTVNINSGLTSTLAGNNTFSGTTLVSGNNTILVLSGSNAGAGGVTVSTNANSAASTQLNINSATALGNGTLTFGGGAATDQVRLDNTSGGNVTLTTSNAFTLNRNFTFVGTNSLDLGNMTTTIGGITAPGARTISVTANTLTFSGEIGATGDIGVTKSGAGTLSFTAANTYGGTTSVNVGTLALSGAGTAGNTSSQLDINGGTFDLGGTTQSKSGVIRFLSGTTANGTITKSGADYDGQAGTVSAALDGAVGLAKSTAGTLTLSGANTYTGNTTITGGTLILTNATALGTTPGANGTSAISMAAGATLRSDVSTTIAAPISLSGVGNITLSVGTTTVKLVDFTGGITGATGNLIFTTQNNTSNPSHVITLGATSSYTGNTTITVGNSNNNLFVKAGGVNSLSPTTVLTMDGGGGSATTAGRQVSYDLNGFNQTLAGLTNNTTGFSTSRNQRITNTGALATLTINNTDDYTYGGATRVDGNNLGNAQITGAIALVKDGAGTFTLGGNVTGPSVVTPGNTFTGNTTILGGTLVLGESISIQNSAFDTAGSIAGNSTAGLRSSVATLTLGGLSGDKNFADVFETTSGNYTSLTALTLNTGANVTYSADIGNGNGSLTLTKSGAGTQTLSGNNTYTGTTTISAGTLALSGAGSLVDTNALNLSGAIGIFDISAITATSETIGSLTGVTGSGVVLGSKNLTVGNATSTAFAGVISGTNGSLTKQGAGNLTLSGNNTYTGATLISAGTLALSGSGEINGSGNITINGSGAKFLQTSSVVGTPAITLTEGTLDGTGTVGAVSVADLVGNTITNGNLVSSSALTLSSLTLGGDATFNIRTVGAAGVIVTGALTTTPASGTALVNVTSPPVWATGTTYDLISFGSLTGALGDFTKGTIAGLGARQSSDLVLNGNNISLSISGESVRWTGNATTAWTTNAVGTPFNWKTAVGLADTEFLALDDVIFDNSATGVGNVTVDITDADVSTNTVLFNASRDYTINGNGSFGIASGTLIISGGGNVTLNTLTNSYAGATTVSAGTLNLNGNLTGGGAITISGTGILTQGAASGISGASSYTQSSPGTSTLAGNNTYTGNTTIGNGTLEISGTGNLYNAGTNTATVTVASGAQVILSGNATNNALGFGASATWNVSGTINSTGGSAQTFAKNVNLNNGTLTGIASIGSNAAFGTFYSTSSINPIITANGANNTISAANVGMNSSSILTLATPLSGDALSVSSVLGVTGGQLTGGLTKTGLGNVTLSGANVYTGTTSVNSGILNLTGNRTASTGTINVGADGNAPAELNISNGSFSITSSMSVGINTSTLGNGTVNHTAGNLTFSAGNQLLIGTGTASGTYNLSGGLLSIPNSGTSNRGIMLGANSGSSGTFNMSGGSISMGTTSQLQIGRSDTTAINTTNLFSQTGGTAAISIFRMGGNATTGTGINSTLTLTGGNFTATTFDRLGLGANNTMTINIGGTADVTLPSFGNGTALGSGSTAVVNFDGGTLRNSAVNTNYLGAISSAFIRAGGARFDTTGGNITITQALQQDGNSTGGGLTKQGTNTLTLAGTNTYTGNTTISGGTLSMGSNLIQNSPNIFIGNGAALNTTGTTFQLTANQNITGTGATGNFTTGSSGILTAGNNTISNNAGGTLTLTRIDVRGGNNTISAGNILATGATNRGLMVANVLNGNLTLSTGASYTSSGAGTLTDLVGSNSGVGTFLIDGGSYTNTANTGSLVLGFATTSAAGSGTLTLTSGSATVNTLGLSGNSTSTQIVNINGGNLTVNDITGNGTGTKTFNFNGGNLIAAGNFTLGNMTAVNVIDGANINTNGNNVTISDALLVGGNATGGLIKTGLGNLTLSSNSSNFTGDVTVGNGTLIVGAAGNGTVSALGSVSNSRTINVASGATLRVDVAGGIFNNNFAAEANTLPTLVISGTMTNGGASTNSALGNITLAGGTLNHTTGRPFGTESGQGYGAWNLNGTVTSTGNSFITSGNASVPVTLSAASGNGNTTTFDVQSGTLTASAALGEVTRTGDERISSLIKTGNGTMVLSGNNSFTGNLTISEGKLIAQTNATALGSNSGFVEIGANGTLQVNNDFNNNVANYMGGNSTVQRAITGSGTLEFTSSAAPTTSARLLTALGSLSGFTGNISILADGNYLADTTDDTTNQNLTIATGGFLTISTSLNAGFGRLDGNGTIMRNAGVATTSTLTLGNGNATGGVFSGTIQGQSTAANSGLFNSSGLIAVIKVGTGTQTLSGANTYAGTTTISAGILSLGNSLAMQNSALDTAGSIAGNSTAGLSSTVASLTMGGLTGNKNLADVFTTSGNYTGLTALTLNPLTGSLSYSGDLGNGDGNMSLNKSGAGTQILDGANSYSGVTNITAGTLQIGAGSTTGTLGSGAVTNAGTLVFNRTDTYALASTNLVTGAGAVTLAGSGNVTVAVDDQFNTTGALNFGGTAGNTTVSALDLTNGSSTFGSMVVRTNSSANNTIAIGTGKTLTINGGVTVGANLANNNSALTASGGGNLVVGNGSNSLFAIGAVTGGTAGGTNAVDLSGLANFTLNYGSSGTLRVGDNNTGSVAPANTTLKLASNNNITVGNLRVGDRNGSAATQTLTLGNGTNIINTNNVQIGANAGGNGIRSSGLVMFDGSDTTGNLTLRGFDGGSTRADLILINTDTNTNGTPTATLDLAGHTADMMVGNLTMARRVTGSGGATANLTFDQGTLDITSLTMASKSGTSGGVVATLNLGDSVAAGVPTVTIGGIAMAVSTGTGSGSANANLNISGGNVSIGSINMANAGNATMASNANLNLTGGTTTLGGNISRTGGIGIENATITLNGGALNMAGNSIGNGTAGISLLAQSGTLSNVASINGTGGLTKTTVGTLTLSGNNSYTGNTTVSAGTLQLSNDNAAGTTGGILLSGANSTLQIDAANIVANAITVSDATASVVRGVAANGTYNVGTTGNLSSNLGGTDTTAKILAGNSTSAATLTMSFSGNNTASNDAIRRSDVFSVSGMGSDAYVLQLTASGLAADSVLGYSDGSVWDFAYVGNTGNNATLAQQNYIGSFTAFQTAFGNVLGDYIGAYGYDSGGTSVWAVVNYGNVSGGGFTAVPEPTSALVGLLIGAGLLRRRRNGH